MGVSITFPSDNFHSHTYVNGTLVAIANVIKYMSWSRLRPAVIAGSPTAGMSSEGCDKRPNNSVYVIAPTDNTLINHYSEYSLR